jgi:hypothetical protein
MNYHNHDHDHINGALVNGNVADEAELDAYQDQLTNEAVGEQLRVHTPIPAF